jgi:hypothetical protein
MVTVQSFGGVLIGFKRIACNEDADESGSTQ